MVIDGICFEWWYYLGLAIKISIVVVLSVVPCFDLGGRV